MTVAATPRKAGPFAGNGVTTAFAFTFQTIAKGDLVVTRGNADGSTNVLVLDSDYTVALNANQEVSPGGTVTYPRVGSPMPGGVTLTISTDEEEAQTTELTLGGGFSPTTLENQLDTVTRLVQQQSERVSRTLRVPVTDSGVLSELPSKSLRAGKFAAYDADGNPTVSAGSGGGDTSLRTDLASSVSGSDGARLVGFRRTDSGSVARSVYAALNQFATLQDFGAIGNGIANDTVAVQAALDSGRSLLIIDGVYKVANLTQSAAFQKIIAIGKVHFEKNANGPICTSSGSDVLWRGIDFRDSGGAFTGKGLVCSGDRVTVEKCGGYAIESTALEMTGAAPLVDGTCNIWHTRTAAGYDIVIGKSGTATLYARVTDVYTSQAGGGIKFIDCGSQSVVGGQFGKYTIEAGTSPAGVNGGSCSSCRILGAIEVGISSAVITGCTIGAVNIHFANGTSGHRLDESNVLQVGATIDDDSNESYIVDSRLIPELQAYTPTWTAAGDAPALGNGTLTAWYTKQGRRVFFTMELVFGTTTTPGTGNWSFSLPYAPIVKQIGVAQAVEDGVNTEGGIVAFAGGVASFQVFPSEAPSNAMGASVPFAWGTADRLCVTGEYYTDP